MENKRAVYLLMAFIFFFLCIAAKLSYLQLFRHADFEEMSLDQHMRIIELSPDRGDICDRNGNILATSVDRWSVYVRPKAIKDKGAIIRQLSEIFPEEKALISAKMNGTANFWLKRKADKIFSDKVRALGCTGIDITMEKKRIYPKGKLASQLIGFAGLDNQGLSGIEIGFEDSLKGKAGRLLFEKDMAGRQIATGSFRQLEMPEEGMNVYLTIDEAIQHIAQVSLKEAVTGSGAVSGSIIVVDVRTGEILAIAGYPDFDPNDYSKYPDESRKLPPVTNIYEPGSTFKIITACAGIEENVVSPDSVIPTPAQIKVEGIKVNNSHPVRYYGKKSKTFADVIAESINTGTSYVGLKLGFGRFYKYITAFGFGTKTGIDYPGEVRGFVRSPENRESGDVVTYTFGQSIAVTPIQLVYAIAAIANDGIRVKPKIIKRIESPDKNVIRSDVPEELGRVISKETVKKVNELMKGVVYMDHGTGHKAKMAQFTVAAKSGTAQISVPGKGYLKGRFVASFVGFIPADRPRIAMLIIINKPSTSNWGAVVAAPVFKEVGEFALRYLNVAPDL
ncbi:MAG: penicillin-binding protein 2 [Candidatus Saganbacteria bacterium]|nr:penicillin-binding protein 2 [Candidatus Saganbacteria bacterium]